MRDEPGRRYRPCYRADHRGGCDRDEDGQPDPASLRRAARRPSNPSRAAGPQRRRWKTSTSCSAVSSVAWPYISQRTPTRSRPRASHHAITAAWASPISSTGRGRRRHPACREGRRDDATESAEGRCDLDADLDVRRVVEVEHRVPSRRDPVARPHDAHTSPRSSGHSAGNASQVVVSAMTAVGRAASTRSVTAYSTPAAELLRLVALGRLERDGASGRGRDRPAGLPDADVRRALPQTDALQQAGQPPPIRVGLHTRMVHEPRRGR